MDEDYSNGNSFLDYLKFGGDTATGILGALNKPKAPKPAQTNWGVIAGIAAAVLVVLVLVVSLGRR